MAISHAKIDQTPFKFVDNLPYSLELAPLDYYLFPKLKERLTDKRHSTSDKVIICAVATRFIKQRKNLF